MGKGIRPAHTWAAGWSGIPRKTAGAAPATARGSTERGIASTARQDGGSSGKNYEERDGSIGPRSLHFYKRLAERTADIAAAIRSAYHTANSL